LLGVALLPFIEEERLLEAILPLYDQLTEEERIRNTRGEEAVFVGEDNGLFEPLCTIYARKPDDKVR
jgi:5'-3' exoribonuclease 2